MSIATVVPWPVLAQTAQHAAVTPASIAARNKQLALQHKVHPETPPNSQQITVLHTFGADPTDTFGPAYSLMQATDGNIYGVGWGGGTSGNGTVYTYSSTAGYATSAPFSSAMLNSGPPVQASDGYLYAVGSGIIWRQWPGSLQAETVATFDAPVTSLTAMVPDGNGNLFGVTASGGTSYYGLIFKYNLQSQTITVLHNFGGGDDGENPVGAPAFGQDGNLYGTTQGEECSGSASPFCGTVWRIGSDGSNFQTLYDFGGGPEGLIFPDTGLVLSSDGNLYGLAFGFATSPGIFSINTSGNAVVSEIASLGDLNGPIYGETPTVDAAGTVYFATNTEEFGGIVKAPLPVSSDTIALVYEFGQVAPYSPVSGPFLGSDGSIYGTTNDQSFVVADPGSLYKITPGVAAPISITGPSTAKPGSTFTLTYEVANYFSNLSTCFITDNVADDTNFPQSAGLYGSLSVTAPLTPGSYTYGYNCGGYESAALTVVVGDVATTTTVAGGAPSYISGQTASVGVTVTAADNTTPSSGTVTLTCGGQGEGSQPLSNGHATFSLPTSGLSAGTYSCTAAYSGDEGQFYAASSGSGSMSVVADSSTTALQLTQYALDIGAPAQLTVTVSGQHSTPAGAVYVNAKDGSGNTYQLASATLNNGVAHVSVDTSTFPAGTFVVYATYPGNAAVSGSATDTGVVLYSDDVSSSLTVDNDNPNGGDTVHITDTVSRTTGSGTASGSVTFNVKGYGALATVPVKNGVAELTVQTGKYSPAAYTVTAVYNGDPSDNINTSNQLTITLHPAAR